MSQADQELQLPNQTSNTNETSTNPYPLFSPLLLCYPNRSSYSGTSATSRKSMKPLLAHTYESHRVTYPCYVQPKLNGIRALYQDGCFQSREELPFPPELLAHLTAPLRQICSPSIILDGELYVHGWPLQRINAAVTPVATRRGASEDTRMVEYHVFDIVDYQKPFAERLVVIPWDEDRPQFIYTVRTAFVRDQIDADRFYAEFVSQGYEGMMYRLGDCPYTIPKQHWAQAGPFWRVPHPRSKYLSDKHNRCWHLLKRKDWQDDEFDFVSIERTVGEKGEPGFKVWCRAKNGKLFKFGAGLSQAEVDHYMQHPPYGQKVKGKYLVLSVEGIPMNGTILAIL